MKTLILLWVMTSSVVQAETVARLRDQFDSALLTYPTSGWSFEAKWVCRTYNAFKNDSYSEPNATLRLQAVSTRHLVNSGNMIFKALTMTAQGLQSVQENEAYSHHRLYMTVRPRFTYPSRSNGAASVRLIGEVSVEPSILKDLATYYGYAKPFAGVPSLVDSSKVVFYYFSCSPAASRVTDQAEARSRTWSIPAELSRQWPRPSVASQN